MVLDDYEINENDLFNCLKWLTLYQRVEYQTDLMAYKTLHGLTASYISDLFHTSGENYGYNLRNSHINLHLPKPRNKVETFI